MNTVLHLEGDMHINRNRLYVLLNCLNSDSHFSFSHILLYILLFFSYTSMFHGASKLFAGH